MPSTERESINFKLPKTLTAALRTAAKERNTTATELVIQGLRHVLGDVPGVETSVETRLAQLEEQLASGSSSPLDNSTERRLTNLEGKIESLSDRIAQFEGRIMQLQHSFNTPNRRYKSGYPYQYNTQPPQLEPLDENKLAMRLSTNVSTLQERHSTMGKEEFEKWCSERDPSKRKWRYSEKDGLYHPVK
ncbi:MAG: hypothetical protein QNJ51_23050 [Calothrix sp. MO_167.B12]|nr:hypothetical protein [Calothrix sp. MO_167.B12]